MRIATSSLVALAISIAMPATVHAQAAEAETLFREGKKLIAKGQYAEACEKFEASDRLDATAGTELNLARCRDKLGQTSSAWAMYVKAAANSKHGTSPHDKQKYDEAKRKAAELEKRLIYLTISVPTEAAVEGLVIKRNQTSIDHALWNQATPVDPDEYTISAEAPDHKAWSVTVAVKTKSKTIEVPALEATEHEVEVHTESHPDVVEPPVEPPAPKRVARGAKHGSTAVTLAVVGGSAFVIALGLGFYANHVEGESDKTCPDPLCADKNAVDRNSSARTAGLIANISWGIGGIAVVGAAAAWWFGRPSETDKVSLAPLVGRDQAGLVLGGRF
jgi:hypothetical protein